MSTPAPHVSPPQAYILRLPSELAIQIATHLSPRGILAMTLALPSFPGLLSSLSAEYTREQRVFENNIAEDCLYRISTPLQYFCSRGFVPGVQRLLATGANANGVSFQDGKNQIPPLVHAIGVRSSRVVALLLAHGAWVDDRNDPAPDAFGASLHYMYRQESPLHAAVGPPNDIVPRVHDQEAYHARAAELPTIVQLLLDAGAAVDKTNRMRHTPLQFACAAGTANPLVVQVLLSAGADVARGTTLVSTGSDLMQISLQRIFRRCDSNVVVLHYAANSGNAPVVRMLLAAGARVDARTRDGMRALDLAVLHMWGDVVEVLVAAGADVRMDGEQMDPVVMARSTATWETLMVWFGARGCRVQGMSLREWWTQGEVAGTSRCRSGQPEDIPGA